MCNAVLNLLSAWSIGGCHIAHSPISALQDVATMIEEKEANVREAAKLMRELGKGRYEQEFSLFNLVRLACAHLQSVYESWEVLKIQEGKNSYFTACAGDHSQNYLPNSSSSRWQKYLLSHNQLSHILVALDGRETTRYKHLAVNVKKVLPGILPKKIKVAKQDKTAQKKPVQTDLGMEDVDWVVSSTLLINATLKAANVGWFLWNSLVISYGPVQIDGLYKFLFGIGQSCVQYKDCFFFFMQESFFSFVSGILSFDLSGSFPSEGTGKSWHAPLHYASSSKSIYLHLSWTEI